MDREPTVLSRLGTLVSEAKEVESFGLVLAASCSSINRMATELDQTRFPCVQFQAELGKPRAEFFQARSRFVLMLETDHKVIRRPTYRSVPGTTTTLPWQRLFRHYSPSSMIPARSHLRIKRRMRRSPIGHRPQVGRF